MSPVKEIRCSAEGCNKYWGLAGPVTIYKSPPCPNKVNGKKCGQVTEFYRNDGTIPIEFLFRSC